MSLFRKLPASAKEGGRIIPRRRVGVGKARGDGCSVMCEAQCFSKSLRDGAGQPLRLRGSLLKKGGSKTAPSIRSSFTMGRRNWQSRWFTLDAENGELRYYEDATMRATKGLVRLRPNSELRTPTKDLRGKHGRGATDDTRYYFEITNCEDEKHLVRSDPFAMRAHSQLEFDQWVASVGLAVRIARGESPHAAWPEPAAPEAAPPTPVEDPGIYKELSRALARRGTADSARARRP